MFTHNRLQSRQKFYKVLLLVSTHISHKKILQTRFIARGVEGREGGREAKKAAFEQVFFLLLSSLFFPVPTALNTGNGGWLEVQRERKKRKEVFLSVAPLPSFSFLVFEFFFFFASVKPFLWEGRDKEEKRE